MNDLKNQTSVSQQKQLTTFFDRLMTITERIEKERYRLDDVCDKLDYSEYYKNHPVPVNSEKCGSDPDESDAQFRMNGIIERLESVEYKISKATDFITNFI